MEEIRIVSILLKEPVQIARSMIDVKHLDSLGSRAIKDEVVFKPGTGKKRTSRNRRFRHFRTTPRPGVATTVVNVSLIASTTAWLRLDCPGR